MFEAATPGTRVHCAVCNLRVAPEMKNITLSADESLIESARAQARADKTTLNEQFRLWLAQYARKQRVQRFSELMDDLQDKASTGGQKFTREEMNER